MAGMKIIITVDDDDAVACPDTPWTANLVVCEEGSGQHAYDDAGIGATVRDAIEDLLRTAAGDTDVDALR